MRWKSHSTQRGLNNPLVKMPVKRFRKLQSLEFASLTDGGSMLIGTTSDPIARNLLKNFKTRINERGEHCAFLCSGSVEMTIAGGIDQQPRTALFPVCLKKASLSSSGQNVRASVADDASWLFNPVLKTHLHNLGITVPETLPENPQDIVGWVRSQLTNRGTVEVGGYIGLFSSQQMVIQERFEDPRLCHVLAKNPVIRSKLDGRQVEVVQLGETTDAGLEDLGMVLPCDDSQLRVVQLSDRGCSMQVEGPPGTGKSQTIANIISNALWRGRRVLLVCDKKAAITQVEERLANAGLKPALLNLHDEDLDKKQFLRQATERFSAPNIQGFHGGQAQYPFEQLSQAREILNDRVRFGRKVCHAALQVSNTEALAGLIQVKKELGNVPALDIANWQALSKERLNPLLKSIGEWPGFAAVVTNSTSLWNRLRTEAFADPNVAHELTDLSQKILTQLETLNELREWIAAVGADSKVATDAEVAATLALAEVVLRRPQCHHEVVGNREVSSEELNHLQQVWTRREELVNARHPVPLEAPYPAEAQEEAKALLESERCSTWQELELRADDHDSQREALEATQPVYRRLCDQLGLVYSPLLKFRRAQLEAVLRLGELKCSIPRVWWTANSTPVLSVAGWIGQFHACGQQALSAPSPLHFIALERVAATHWEHVEAKAEHGFNLVSYCLKFVNDRKCKFALSQVYPGIPARGFRDWRGLTLHAISTHRIVVSLRAASETHVVLKQLAANYLATGHEQPKKFNEMLDHEDVRRLEAGAVLVEQLRDRNDLFDVAGVHWQTLWEAANPRLVGEVRALLDTFDRLVFPKSQSDDVESALEIHKRASEAIRIFLRAWKLHDGDSAQSVLMGFEAQREFARCNELLTRLEHYKGIHTSAHPFPDWGFMLESLEWGDAFVQMCGTQRLDIDRKLWSDIYSRLEAHQVLLAAAYERLNHYFPDTSGNITNYDHLVSILADIQMELPRYQLWVQKKKWREKIRGAYPEIVPLWNRVLDGTIQPQDAKRLFCYNLLRLCKPVAQPEGPELQQILQTFVEQDERLTEWTVNDLKRKLLVRMQKAEAEHGAAHGELRRLQSLKALPAVRKMVNNSPKFAFRDFLVQFKPCWMMSPTSLANLVDLSIFDGAEAPFDLVIFDEASQIRVLDGLLSMSFGTQVIVVGDKKQLPPTDFFASFANPDGDDDSTDSAISESLLDEFTGQLQDEMLMSHYRSETPDLIRFSNDWFYCDESGKGRLELYPPAHVSGVGRRLHYVRNAVYSETPGQRSNRREAEEVVGLIGAHVRDCPDKSLGVVTMNIPQMELIEDLLVGAQSHIQSFCADEAKFFLRNLETVQGDEMDRIIVSLTYGKNPAGHFSAAVLGPLIKRGGERRLNVAITRSRSGMSVVTSLTSADLAASGATSEGFRCFKSFLQDLEAAATVSNFGITAQRFQRQNNGVSNLVFCDSPFEEQVVEFLENQGFTELECQHGCGKFRIDIVVKERGKNLLAIECDGASYHSSLVARTRDRARQRILESRGWKGRIHRVWSTNWWYFEDQEKKAILAAIAAARQVRDSSSSNRPLAPYPAQSVAPTVVQSSGGNIHAESVDFGVDDAGNVVATSKHTGTRPTTAPPITPLAANTPRQQVSTTVFQSSRSAAQPQLELEPAKKIGEVRVTASELRNAFYQFLPKSGQIDLEQLRETISTHLGLQLKQARPELNRLVYDERRARHVEVDLGWKHVWRV